MQTHCDHGMLMPQILLLQHRLPKVIDMTGADNDEESGVQDRDGFLSVVSRRGDDALWPPPFLPQCRLFQSISPSIAEIEAVVSQSPEFGDA